MLEVAEQVSIKVFLKDPVYRKYFQTMPVLLPHMKHETMAHPWWLYLQYEKEGAWKRAPIKTYKGAFTWVKNHLGDLYDFAITSRRRTYLPPTHRPVKFKEYWAEYPRTHSWCPYCRRPTIFRPFTRHHIDLKVSKWINTDNPPVRCTICGIREEAVRPWMRLGRAS